MEISAPGESDFDEIYGLLQLLWPEKPMNKERVREIYNKGLIAPGTKYLVAKKEARVIGFITLTIRNSLWCEGPLAQIDELVVRKDHRGQGIGKILIEEITETARKESAVVLEADSAIDRKDAHRFYESNDFKKGFFLFSKDI